MAHFDTDTENFDVVSAMMDYEAGELDTVDTLEMFSHMIRSGMAWRLQGSYGRMAASLIDAGYISDAGEILRYVDDED